MRRIPGTREYGFEIILEETAIKDLLDIRPSDITPNKELSYCRNVFVPLTTACRYTCTYCTYFDPPGKQVYSHQQKSAISFRPGWTLDVPRPCSHLETTPTNATVRYMNNWKRGATIPFMNTSARRAKSPSTRVCSLIRTRVTRRESRWNSSRT